MTEITVRIPKTFSSQSKEKYTLYEVQVTGKKEGIPLVWTVHRRYQEFHKLNEQLQKKFGKELSSLTFPPKKAFGRFDPAFIESRRSALGSYLSGVLNTTAALSTLIKDFLEIDLRFSNSPGHKFAKVLQDWKPKSGEELELKRGDVAVVMGQHEDGWYDGYFHGKFGLVPGNIIKIVDHIDQLATIDLPAAGEAGDVASAPKVSDSQKKKRMTVFLSNEIRSSVNVREEKRVVAKARVLYAWKNEGSHDGDVIELFEGDELLIYSMENDNGWWLGETRGCYGYFPKDFAEILELCGQNSSPNASKGGVLCALCQCVQFVEGSNATTCGNCKHHPLLHIHRV